MSAEFWIMSLVFLAVVAVAALVLVLRMGRKGGEEASLVDQLTQERADLEKDLAVARDALLHERERAKDEAERREAAEQARDAANSSLRALHGELAAAKATLNERTATREAMMREFQAMAQEILTAQGKSIGEQNRQQVDLLLEPLRDQLTKFQAELSGSHKESLVVHSALKERIDQLSNDSARVSNEAAELAKALRGQSHTQGAWGEMILSSILERSGLRQGEQYRMQSNHVTEEGARLRPDVIVDLPGSKQIVIDSKVSLTAYAEYVNATEDGPRDAALVRHAASLRGHIKGLSRKEYQALPGMTFDYVVMFLPVEGSLSAALQKDPQLMTFALEHNVAIATPATLMLMLRTVENIWQVESRNRNAEEIAYRAGKLYDKFVGFIDDMQGIGANLEKTRKSHSAAMKKLVEDPATSLAQQAEELKQLGAKASKQLPQKMLVDATPVNGIQ
ncbi:hypothetical protein F183_A02870 [Bryobacterales bacterium F-183]|nr:hypothetical protein F183_A02870 [Bryobacterales bacterium F-183]